LVIAGHYSSVLVKMIRIVGEICPPLPWRSLMEAALALLALGKEVVWVVCTVTNSAASRSTHAVVASANVSIGPVVESSDHGFIPCLFGKAVNTAPPTVTSRCA
jgi:hypothetical protein